AAQVIAFEVADSGVGIPANKQKVIFEAFQQADGTTSRRHGGTGLGLSISRELTGLLGGEITVESVPGTGSTFVLYLPLPREPAVARAPPAATGAETPAPRVPVARHAPQRPRADTDDDRDNIDPGDRVVLIVEDDTRFAATLLDIAHEQGFKGVIASDGGAALALAQALRPDAITLDLRLPDVDGWVVLERLKHSVQTRHIPVSLVSLVDQTGESLHLSAVAVVRKELASEALQEALLKMRSLIERDAKALLVADGDEARRSDVEESLRCAGVQFTSASLGTRALEALRAAPCDCVLLGPALSDMSAIGLLRRIAGCEAITEMQFVTYGTESLGSAQQQDLHTQAEVLVMKKGPTREAMLQQITLFL
ncbi:MAG TPA: response regulator, partial [Steroidobacteraceae bacterium]|nr:response regulator [Steroidobacteraceae bacterium]